AEGAGHQLGLRRAQGPRAAQDRTLRAGQHHRIARLLPDSRDRRRLLPRPDRRPLDYLSRDVHSSERADVSRHLVYWEVQPCTPGRTTAMTRTGKAQTPETATDRQKQVWDTA